MPAVNGGAKGRRRLPPPAPRPGEGRAERPDAGGRGAHQRALRPTRSRAPARRRNRRGMRRSEVSAPWADAPVRPRESQNRVERLLDVNPDADSCLWNSHTPTLGVSQWFPDAVWSASSPSRIDRTQPILDIFAQHATTRDGNLQVELAQLRYLLPRLAQARRGLAVATRRWQRRTGTRRGEAQGRPRLRFPRERKVIVTDTVGSIRGPFPRERGSFTKSLVCIELPGGSRAGASLPPTQAPPLQAARAASRPSSPRSGPQRRLRRAAARGYRGRGRSPPRPAGRSL